MDLVILEIKAYWKKIIICFNWEKSDDENIKTIPTFCVNETPSKNYSKQDFYNNITFGKFASYFSIKQLKNTISGMQFSF